MDRNGLTGAHDESSPMTGLYSSTSTLKPASNKFATVSLVLGVTGWVIYLLQWCFDLTLGLFLAALTGGLSAVCGTLLDILPFMLWLTGIVGGHVSLNQIQQSGAPGKSRAILGLVLNYFGLFFIIIFIIVIIVLITTGVEAGWVEKLLLQIRK